MHKKHFTWFTELALVSTLALSLLQGCAAPATPTEVIVVPTPTEEPVAPSGDGATAVTLTITNYSSETITIYWSNFDGQEEFYYALESGTQIDIDTYSTHVWRIRDAAGKIVTDIVTTEDTIQVADINPDKTVSLTVAVPCVPGETGPELSLQVPTGGNSWIENDSEASLQMIDDSGINNWMPDSGTIITYVYLPQPGDLEVALNASVPDGCSVVEVSVGSVTNTVSFDNASLQQIYAGNFPVDQAGYVGIRVRAVATSGSIVAKLPAIFLGGSATEGVAGGTPETQGVSFIANPEDFYYGRRGPSVNIFYQMPTSQPVEYFYSEVTVPEDQDVLNTYFMAAGFEEGYFGFQVNSPTERQVIFSIWSPYETDDSSNIPDEYKIELLRSGEGVVIGEFGGEGSGGQSYLPYMWQVGQTYRFLVKATPMGNGSTEFTGYFYAPEVGQWQLLASFRRPMTDKYLTGLYSFLENFSPETGQFTRYGLYGNEWIRTANGQWMELTKANFGYDATADNHLRWDYQGGVRDGQFYLMNCGFFSDFSTYGTLFERSATNAEPDIDLTQLP